MGTARQGSSDRGIKADVRAALTTNMAMSTLFFTASDTSENGQIDREHFDAAMKRLADLGPNVDGWAVTTLLCAARLAAGECGEGESQAEWMAERIDEAEACCCKARTASEFGCCGLSRMIQKETMQSHESSSAFPWHWTIELPQSRADFTETILFQKSQRNTY